MLVTEMSNVAIRSYMVRTAKADRKASASPAAKS